MSRKTGIIALVVIVGLIIGGYTYWSRPAANAQSSATATKPKASKPRPVHIITVQRGTIRQQTGATGDILAAAQVEIFSKVEGRVDELSVEQGDTVQKGQVIAQIADDELAAKAERAAAQLEAVQAEWAQMQAGERQEEIAQALDRVQRTQAELTNARREFKRSKALFEKGLYASQQLDDARLKTTQARTAHAVADKQLRILRSGARVEDRQALRARMRAAEAALRLSKTELRNAVITAPINGIISHRHIDSGSYVTDRNALVTVVDMQSVKIRVPISERDIVTIQPGLPADIRVDAYPRDLFTGIVKRISPTIDPANRSGDVEIAIDNADLRLKPGMFANVMLVVQERQDVVLIPLQALHYKGDTTAVFVVEDGKAHLRNVTIGLQNETDVEITAHLEAGTTIVLAGHHALKDQAPVIVVPAKEAS